MKLAELPRRPAIFHQFIYAIDSATRKRTNKEIFKRMPTIVQQKD